MKSSLVFVILVGAAVLIVVTCVWQDEQQLEQIAVRQNPPTASVSDAPFSDDSKPSGGSRIEEPMQATDEGTPRNADAALSEFAVRPESSATAGLILGGKIVPGKAIQLLDSGFDDLLAELARQAAADAGSAEMRQLYSDQITDLLAESEVTLRRMEFGASVCAAELFRAEGADPTDPFANPEQIGDRLPRDARVELSLLDADRNALRRFIFSIDPRVTSLYVPPRKQ